MHINAIMLSPDDKPSIPSMRFMAFVTYTTVNIVNGIPNHQGISSIKKTCAISAIHSPDMHIRMPVSIWMENFNLYGTLLISSNNPILNNIIPPAIKAIQCSIWRCSLIFSYMPKRISTTTMIVIVTIIIGKNIMPPRRGMGNLCIFLSSSGRSYNFKA